MHNNLDQAAGLRRLLLRNQHQVITVVAGKAGIGRTTTVINLASAFTQAGKDVLVLDENLSQNSLLSRLGLNPRFDLLDITVQRCNCEQALSNYQGFSVLSTARTMKALHRFGPTEQKNLEHTFSQLSQNVDIMLVDASSLIGQAAVDSSLATAASVLVVVEPSSQGITEGYALIKQLALNNARYTFQIVVNRAANQLLAQTIFNNMASVARHKLGARLEYLGFIPADPMLERANQLGSSVLQSFPTAPAAQQFRHLAEKLLHGSNEQDEIERDISQIVRKLVIQLRNKRTSHVIN